MKYRVRMTITSSVIKVIHAKNDDKADEEAHDLCIKDVQPHEITAQELTVDSVEPVPSTKKKKA